MSDYKTRPAGLMLVQRIAVPQKSWATGAGHAAKTHTFHVNGTLVRFDAIISSVTANPTVAITFRDENSCILVPDALCADLADGTNHIKLALSHKATPDADFNPVPLDNDVTVSIDPSADAAGSAQLLTVDLILYVV